MRKVKAQKVQYPDGSRNFTQVTRTSTVRLSMPKTVDF